MQGKKKEKQETSCNINSTNVESLETPSKNMLRE